MIGKYLVHSFIYYRLHDSIISDAEFDVMCKTILENWDTIEHPHKHLLSKEVLEAGSGYHIKFKDYPLIVQNIAYHALEWKKLGKDYFKFLEEEYERETEGSDTDVKATSKSGAA